MIFHKLASYTGTHPNCVRKIFGTKKELRKIIRGMEVSDFRGSPVVRIYLNRESLIIDGADNRRVSVCTSSGETL